MLRMLKASGRKLFLATNSLWDYTNVVMPVRGGVVRGGVGLYRRGEELREGSSEEREVEDKMGWEGLELWAEAAQRTADRLAPTPTTSPPPTHTPTVPLQRPGRPPAHRRLAAAVRRRRRRLRQAGLLHRAAAALRSGPFGRLAAQHRRRRADHPDRRRRPAVRRGAPRFRVCCRCAVVLLCCICVAALLRCRDGQAAAGEHKS